MGVWLSTHVQYCSGGDIPDIWSERPPYTTAKHHISQTTCLLSSRWAKGEEQQSISTAMPNPRTSRGSRQFLRVPTDTKEAGKAQEHCEAQKVGGGR